MESELLEKAVGYIRELRNNRNSADNWKLFRSLIADNEDNVIRSFSIRWLVSVCDTYADFGDEIERRDALLISAFVNTLRIAEVVRYASGPPDPEKLYHTRGGVIFYDDVGSFNIDRQDVFLNLTKRAQRQLGDTFMRRVWDEVTRRILELPTVVAELRGYAALPERYFPVNALELADNYGVV